MNSGENAVTWWYRTPAFFMVMQGVTPLLRTSCAAGKGIFWKIHRTRPIWHHASDPYNTRDEVIRATECSIRNINKNERADGIWRLPSIWLKVVNKGDELLPLIFCSIVYLSFRARQHHRSLDYYDGQMIFVEPWGPKASTQETCSDLGSNLGPLRDRCACYRLLHSGGPLLFV